MKRLALLLSVLVPPAALAGWVSIPAPGSPQDLVAVDAGILVYSSTGAGVGTAVVWAVAADAGVTQLAALPSGNYVGATYTANGCLMGIVSTRTTFVTAACGAVAGPVCPGCTAARLRSAPSGLFLWTFNVNAAQGLLYSAGAPQGPYAIVGGLWALPASVTAVLNAARVGAVDFGAFNYGGVGTHVGLSVDGGAPTFASAGASLRDLSLFDWNGAPGLVGVTAARAAVLLDDLRLPTPAIALPSLPAGATPDSVAFTLQGGSAAGAGFGLMSSTTGAVYSPVPDPRHPAGTWVVRSGAPPLTGRVTCVDARFCAAFGSAGAVAVYFNEQPPALGMPPTLTVVEGTALNFTVDAGDPDGDPVFVSWASPGLTVTEVVDGGDGRTVRLSAPAGTALCSAATTSLTATVSDGLATHVVSATVPVTVPRTQPVAPPLLSPLSRATFAGGPAVGFTVSTDGGCTPSGFTWTSPDGGSTTGQLFSWTPPATLCSPDGGAFTVGVQSWDSSGTSAPVQGTIVVEPWGAALAPVFADAGVQLAGSAQLWPATGATHVCEGTPGFPLTALVWTRIDAGPGISALPVDGGLLVTTTDRCQSGVVSAEAQRRVLGDPHGLLSPPGTLSVSIVVQSWGAPLAPVFADAGVQLAGSAQLWPATGATHACEGTPGFPLTALVWTRIDAGSGISALPVDGGLLVSTSDRCLSGVVSAEAQRRVLGDAGLLSPPGTLSVSIVADPPPITAQTPFSMGFQGDGGPQVSGFFTVDAGCPGAHLLAAQVEVQLPDASVVSSGAFAVPGPWQLDVPGGCAGGAYVAVARLTEDGGLTSVEERRPFQTAPLPTALGPVAPRVLELVCGSSTTAQVRVEPVAGTCPVVDVRWQQLGAPLLQLFPLDGGALEVATGALGFEAITETVVLEASVPGSTARSTAEIAFTAKPFLHLEATVAPVPAREEEAAEVRVAVSNRTACAATVDLRVSFLDLSLLPGTVTFNGVPLAAAALDGALELPGLVVERTADLRFQARPVLLGRPRVTAEAHIGALKVSIDEPAAPASTGCGCHGGQGRLAWLVALLPSVWLRRRRAGVSARGVGCGT